MNRRSSPHVQQIQASGGFYGAFAADLGLGREPHPGVVWMFYLWLALTIVPKTGTLAWEAHILEWCGDYNFFLPGSYNIRCRRLELRPGSTLLQLAGGSRPRKADRPLGTRVLKAP